MKSRRGRKRYRGGHPIQFTGVPGVINIDPTGAADTWGNLIDGIRDFLNHSDRGASRHRGNFTITATLPTGEQKVINSQDEEEYDDEAISILAGSVIRVDTQAPIYTLFVERDGNVVPFYGLNYEYYEENTTYRQLIVELQRMFNVINRESGLRMNVQTLLLRVRHANGRTEEYRASDPKVANVIQPGDVIVIVEIPIDRLTEGVKDPSFNKFVKYMGSQNDPSRGWYGGRTRKNRRRRR